MKDVVIYTDGSCLSNGKDNAPGGYAAVAIYIDTKGRQHMSDISGGIEDTTNNRAEMVAVIEGLKLLKEPCNVKVVSDSMYIINTMTKGWRKNANTDLWSLMEAEVAKHQVSWKWVKGHKGDFHNEVVNSLAQTAAAKTASGEALKIVEYGRKEQNDSEPQNLFKEHM